MSRRPELSAAVALGWSLLLTLSLASLGVLVGLSFGGSNLGLIAGGFLEFLLVVPAAGFIARLYGPPRRAQALALNGAPPLELSLGASLGVLLHLPVGYVSALVERRFPTPQAELAAQLRQLTPESVLLGAGMLLAVAVLVPFAEELYFRGALFTGLLRSNPAFVAVWTSSLAFVLAHPKPRDFAPLFLVALVLGELRRLGGSIWAPVALHAAFNATTLLFVFVTKPVQVTPQESSLSLALSGAALCVIGVWVFGRVSRRRVEKGVAS